MVQQELAQKLQYVAQQFKSVMPQADWALFRQAIQNYIQYGSFRTSVNQNVNNLAQAVIQSMINEKISNSQPVGARRAGQWGRWPTSFYWYNPWWWNYWYYYWRPYYWWPYGQGWVGGSKDGGRVGHGSSGPLGVLDQAVDIDQLNLSCDTNRQCTMTVQFTKAPVSWDQGDTDFDLSNVNLQ